MSNHEAHSSRRTKYARARVKAGKTYKALRAELGISFVLIRNADAGKLPTQKVVRESYLRAIGMEVES